MPIRIMICMRSQTLSAELHSILQANGYNVVGNYSAAAEALRAAASSDIDVAVLGFNFTDMTGVTLAQELQGSYGCSVLMIVPTEQEHYVRSMLEEDVLCLTKPVSKMIFLRTLDTMLFYRKKLLALREEKASLQRSIDRRALAEKAKAALMAQMGMTESEAWRFIQKKSMNSGKPLEEIAQSILEIVGKGK